MGTYASNENEVKSEQSEGKTPKEEKWVKVQTNVDDGAKSLMAKEKQIARQTLKWIKKA